LVAKQSIEESSTKKVYFLDVEMQACARYYATLFNKYNPPKKVDYVMAFILQLCDRDEKPMFGVENFIDGEYRKHNNNFGFVSEDERNTPQAFSHFTYECSSHKLLVCDIQGVGDLYTVRLLRNFTVFDFLKRILKFIPSKVLDLAEEILRKRESTNFWNLIDATRFVNVQCIFFRNFKRV
jgi:elongation factor 2 kinase